VNEPDGFGSFFWWLSVTANWAQLESYELNKKQISNDSIMKHLQEQDNVLEGQDKMLAEQTNVFLKQILANQEKIIELLKGDKNGK
jgi:predicted metal-binding transcription factor (methanogenesis marker protein 9)